MQNTTRTLSILKCLQEKSDEQHPLSTNQILKHLESCDIKSNRRTISSDIKLLIDCGIDIVEVKSKQNLYFVGERHFELPELKLLIDAVQASRFLTIKRSRALINKLLNFASPYQAKDLRNGLYFDQKTKPKNETVYITVDLLLRAISLKKRVSFLYYDYAPDKKKSYKHNRRKYEFSPWAFLWNNDHYYAIGHSEVHEKTITFRVDRIASPKLVDIDAVPQPKDFNLSIYAKSVFQMYDGPMTDVTLKCENHMMKTIIDRFGESVNTAIADPEHFYAKVNVSASKTFYGWIFGMDGAIEIAEPLEAVDEYKAMLGRAR